MQVMRRLAIMQIDGLTDEQIEIADTLWQCETEDEVREVINQIGDEAYTVYQLMVAAHFDANCEDVTEAREYLNSIRGCYE
jgi:alpha-D-ribose 1-methylphosphonate 5-triphosphate diphosphatase PhnM